MRDLWHQHVSRPGLVAAIFLAILIVGLVAVLMTTLPRILSGREDIFPGRMNSTTVVTQTYGSARLGVRFSYADQDLGKKILVEEIGNTIYVYTEGTAKEHGQFVQVFSKEPSLTLQQAVERRFLPGYDRSRCYVQTGTDVNGSQPAAGIAAIIAYPIAPAGDDWLMNAEQCPTGYSFTNGLSYFWTDTEDSNKFVFFSIGQYYIPATSSGRSWHDTLQFESGSGRDV